MKGGKKVCSREAGVDSRDDRPAWQGMSRPGTTPSEGEICPAMSHPQLFTNAANLTITQLAFWGTFTSPDYRRKTSDFLIFAAI